MLVVAALAAVSVTGSSAHAYQKMPTPKLHVVGRFLEDPKHKVVTLHGYMQPGGSWFNGEGHNYQNPADFTSATNVAPALNYFDEIADIMSSTKPLYNSSHGWYCSFVRYIGDEGSASNFAPGWDVKGNLHDPAQFEGWIHNMLVPYINHCKAEGLYVVLVGNPSTTYPKNDEGDNDTTRNMSEQYQQNLIKFWKVVASDPGIKDADNVMFEICNEPIAIETSFGTGDWGSGNDAHWAALARFMQPIADAIRAEGADNVIWVPGLGWQGEYQGFPAHPIKGKNMGYAAHIYPAYGGAHDDPGRVAKVWATNYQACAEIAPMIITEMMWEPNNGRGYQDLWNAHTVGFGNAIKTCIDAEGNVSYLIGMTGDHFVDLQHGIDTSRQSTTEGSRAAFDWFYDYANSASNNTKNTVATIKNEPLSAHL